MSDTNNQLVEDTEVSRLTARVEELKEYVVRLRSYLKEEVLKHFPIDYCNAYADQKYLEDLIEETDPDPVIVETCGAEFPRTPHEGPLICDRPPGHEGRHSEVGWYWPRETEES